MDAALLDLSLPDAYEFDGLDRVRGLVPDMPVLMITGNADRRTVTQALGRGANDYLLKGQIDPQRLQNSRRASIRKTHLHKVVRSFRAEGKKQREPKKS